MELFKTKDQLEKERLEKLLLECYPTTPKALVHDMRIQELRYVISCSLNRKYQGFGNKNSIISRKVGVTMRAVQKWFPKRWLSIEAA